jgi:glycosyltransferase involved in cell wall biosynthesis
MKILHLNGSYVNGGASVAGYRIHRALLADGCDTRMRVLDYSSLDPTVLCGCVLGSESLPRLIKRRLALKAHAWRQRHFRSSYPSYLSTAWPETGILREQSVAAADLIHLHWIGKHLISIEEIGRLTQPVVWTLHDQWPFSGAEHWIGPGDDRYLRGYPASYRPAAESGIDINRLTFLRKRRHWRRPMHIVASSQWMASFVQQSFLMRDWPLHVIPLPLDLDQWAPLPMLEARAVLKLPSDCQIILFAAHGAFSNPIKGGDLLLAALRQLDSQKPVMLIVAGEESTPAASSSPVPITFLGCLSDPISMRLAFAAADLVVVPSRRESFCQVASEAHACGRPVVAFAEGGLNDVVADRQTGALATPGDPSSLAAMLSWVLADSQRCSELSHQARQRAESLWAPSRIAKMYRQVYESALASRPHGKGSSCVIA